MTFAIDMSDSPLPSMALAVLTFWVTTCRGADKCVDLANVFLVKCVRVVTAKDNEGNKGEVTNTTRMTIYCQITDVFVKFVVVVFGLQLDGRCR